MPTSHLYWHLYPYRLILNAKGYGNKKNKRVRGCANLLIEELRSCFPSAFDKDVMRVAHQKQRVIMYIASHDVLEIMAGAWHDRVVEVAGPINNYHIELLTDPECDTVLTEHKWYHLFNMRVRLDINCTRTPIPAKQYQEQLVQTLKQNLENFKCIMDPMHTWGGGTGFTFYTDHAEFTAFRGLFKLAFPEECFAVEMARCFVNDDKYLS